MTLYSPGSVGSCVCAAEEEEGAPPEGAQNEAYARLVHQQHLHCPHAPTLQRAVPNVPLTLLS